MSEPKPFSTRPAEALALERADFSPFWTDALAIDGSRQAAGVAAPASPRERLLALDRSARQAFCLGEFAPLGVFGASAALFAASPEAPHGLGPRKAPLFGVERLRGASPPSPAFAHPQRRLRLAASLRLWRAAKAEGLALSEEQHLLLASALFRDVVWDQPFVFEKRTADAPFGFFERRSRFANGGSFSGAAFFRLWLRDAQQAGGAPLLGDIFSLFASRLSIRNRWIDRSEILLSADCAPFFAWDLPIPWRMPAPENEPGAILAENPLPMSEPFDRASPREPEPLCLAWTRVDLRGQAASTWALAARARGMAVADALPASLACEASRAMLGHRLRERAGGSALNLASEADASSWLHMLAIVARARPFVGDENPKGSLLWLWADRLSDFSAPAAMPGPGDFDLEHAGFRALLDIGQWLSSMGASPLTPGPDGLSPLQKIANRSGYGELAARWESLELRSGLPASDADAPPHAPAARRARL